MLQVFLEMTRASHACNLDGMDLKKRIEELLAAKKANMSDLATFCGVTPQAVQQWVSMGRMPRPERLKRIAKYFGISESELFNNLPTKPPMEPENVLPGPAIRGKVPLISWVIAGDFCESPDNFQPGWAEDWLDCPVPHSPSSYSLEVVGDSMDGEGGYRDGEIIFVDPNVNPVPGKDVVVRTPDGKTTFKRLKQDTEGLYLLGLNGKKIIRVPEGTHICGVVIFSGFKR